MMGLPGWFGVEERQAITSRRGRYEVRWVSYRWNKIYLRECCNINNVTFKLSAYEAFIKLLGVVVLGIGLLMLPWDAQAVERDYLGVPVGSNALAYAAGGLILADWSQTVQVENNPSVQEDNKYLGKRPSRGDVNRYFIMKLTGHVFVNVFRPLRKLKNFWNIYQIGITFNAVRGNYKLGLRVKL